MSCIVRLWLKKIPFYSVWDCSGEATPLHPTPHTYESRIDLYYLWHKVACADGTHHHILASCLYSQLSVATGSAAQPCTPRSCIYVRLKNTKGSLNPYRSYT